MLKVSMNNCKDVVSSEHKVVSQSPSKRDINIDAATIDVHHVSGSHLDDSLEGMPSLINVSPIAELNKQTSHEANLVVLAGLTLSNSFACYELCYSSRKKLFYAYCFTTVIAIHLQCIQSKEHILLDENSL